MMEKTGATKIETKGKDEATATTTKQQRKMQGCHQSGFLKPNKSSLLLKHTKKVPAHKAELILREFNISATLTSKSKHLKKKDFLCHLAPNRVFGCCNDQINSAAPEDRDPDQLWRTSGSHCFIFLP